MKRAAYVVAAYALLALIVIPVFPHFLSPNEFTRWATAVAIVELHTLEVTRLLPLLGGDFEDLSVVNGRYYSNKAPGGAFVGLPGYAAGRAIVGTPTPQNVRVTMTAMRLLCATLPAVLLALAFIGVAARFGADQIAPAAAALLFGTPLFAYGLLNFSHALTAAALFGAWALLFVKPSSVNDVAAGALIGLAVLSEYPAAIAGAVIVAFAIGHRNVLRVIAGGLPFAAALAIYNRVIFGSYFALSSGFERDPAFRAMAKQGLFGISLPDPIVLARLLFDPTRGLFVFSPILLVGLAALPRVRSALTPRQFWSLVAVPVAILLMYAGYPNWHGGWTVGARYLVPAMPFFALFVAFTRSWWLPSLALGASVLAVTMTSLVFPFVPPNVPAPWATFAWPILQQGLIGPNLFHLVARALAIAIPFAIVVAAVVASTPKPLAILAGIVVWMAAALALPVPPIVTIQRAFIEEVSFERNGAIGRAARGGSVMIHGIEQRARYARRQAPSSWPF